MSATWMSSHVVFRKLSAVTLLIAVPVSASIVVNSPVQHQWVSSALRNGGYARCINPSGCRNAYAPYDQFVAGYGQVYQGAVIDGSAADGSVPVDILVVYPLGSANLPYTGIYTRADDWEGVV